MAEEKQSLRIGPRVETRLASADIKRLEAAAEKAGKLDAKAIADALRGLTITPDKTPGILIEATWDETGEIDRISFLAEIKDGKQIITETLPKLKK